MAEIVETKTDEAGQDYIVYDDGSERWKVTGYWKLPPRGMSIPAGAAGSERGRELLQRRKTKAVISHMRGLAQKEGVPLPADMDIEKIVQGASDGIEALTAHLKNTFLKSSNLRGMGEAWGKLTAPMLGAPDGEQQQPASNGRLVLLIATLSDRQAIIEGDARDVTELRPIDIAKGI